MIKVLQIEPSIMQYRVPVFNLISKEYDYTVAYIENDKSTSKCLFKKMYLETSKIGPFTFLTKKSRKLLNDYDVVITSQNFRFLDSILIGLFRTKFKTIGWNIGIRASYTKNYNALRKHTFLDWLYGYLMFKFDALIFYMVESKKFWHGKKLNNVFVAPNTTEVAPIEFVPELKKDFLFVGTLYKSKGLDRLINSYKKVADRLSTIPMLHIVGGGAERNLIENMVEELGLAEKVCFHGPIYDEAILAKRFQCALLCISPNQAGLSVPKSMGYGVTFITRKDSITGGEIYHITNNVNGVLYSYDEDLAEIMYDAVSNPTKYIEMGKEARSYYENYATPEIMAQGAINAINFVMSK